MSLRTSTAAVTTTPTQLGTAKTPRTQLVVYPDASTTVYIGDSSVTTASGIPLAPGDDPFSVYAGYLGDTSAAQAFYARTASGTASLAVMEIIQ